LKVILIKKLSVYLRSNLIRGVLLKMKNKLITISYIILILLYFTAIFANFIALYKYDTQDREHSYQKPSKIRFDFEKKKFYFYPYKLVSKSLKTYEQDKTKKVYINFLTKGYEYKFLFLKTNIHLIGSENENRFYLFGTDKHGRCIFSRLVKASRISLSIGFIGVLITFIVGMLIGGISGYAGGKTDTFIMRICEVLMCFPFFYLMLALRAVLPVNLTSFQVYLCVIVIFSFLGWPSFARVIRGLVLSIKNRDYIQSAKISGIGNFRIIYKHVLPNTLSYALTSAFISIPAYILGEAGLSFLGLGIQDPEPSWGNMLTCAMNVKVLTSFPWILSAGFMIFITVISFNIVGDYLRDKFDPKNQDCKV
jgi:peptide/nickel transport system permease protein